MSLDKTKVGKPISVKDINNLHLEEKATKLIANILFNKAAVVKDNIKKELNITQDQFETILRKDSTRFATLVLAGTESSIMAERYYFDKKYIFSINVNYITNVIDNKAVTTINYDVFKEEAITDLEGLLNIDTDKGDE